MAVEFTRTTWVKGHNGVQQRSRLFKPALRKEDRCERVLHLRGFFRRVRHSFLNFESETVNALGLIEVALVVVQQGESDQWAY